MVTTLKKTCVIIVEDSRGSRLNVSREYSRKPQIPFQFVSSCVE
jgi:hypothetical protein